jgi:threonine dehydrogenase-like Zn-dependent dehydrogenase
MPYTGPGHCPIDRGTFVKGLDVSHVRAATLVAPHRIEILDYPMPDELAPGAVLLRMIASGICGTDKHTFRGETVQYAGTEMERTTPFPIIQGHENLGVVEAVGPGGVFAHDGTPLVVGDRVVPAPNVACGRCRNCLADFPYYLCRHLANYGNSLTSAQPPHLFGGWAEYLYLKPGTAVFKVPADLPSDIAVLTEIFAVTHSLDRAAAVRRPGGFRPGDSVAVVGVGSLGMAHLVKAAIAGAGRVIAVDRSPKRLALAERLVGAETVRAPSVASTTSDADHAAADDVYDRTDGGADVVINATGFPGSFAAAARMVRDGGTILEVGAFVDMGQEPFNPAVICGRSLTVMGTGGEDLQAYAGTLALLARHRGSVPFAEMISHRFPIGDAEEAMRVAMDPENSTKVLISDALS